MNWAAPTQHGKKAAQPVLDLRPEELKNLLIKSMRMFKSLGSHVVQDIHRRKRVCSACLPFRTSSKTFKLTAEWSCFLPLLLQMGKWHTKQVQMPQQSTFLTKNLDLEEESIKQDLYQHLNETGANKCCLACLTLTLQHACRKRGWKSCHLCNVHASNSVWNKHWIIHSMSQSAAFRYFTIQSVGKD